MQATASPTSNKWLDRRVHEGRKTLAAPATLRTQKTGRSQKSELLSSSRVLLQSVAGGSALTSRQLQDLLNTPDDKCSEELLKQTAFALLDQAKSMEVQTKVEQQTELGTTSMSLSLQSRVDHAKFRRTALIHEQEALRAEILQLNDRISKLETLKANAFPYEQRPKKHSPSINQKKLKPEQIEKELLEMGVKKNLTITEKVALNDQEVKTFNTELLNRQRLAIEEMSKFELLQLKKPQFVLLMDRLTR